MLTRNYRALSQRCAEAIVEQAENLGVETENIAVKDLLVTVKFDGYPDNHRPARYLREYADGLRVGYEIYQRDLETGVKK